MHLPKTILVPTDFSESSDAALAYAVELAKTLGASVVALHTYDIPMVGFPDGTLVATADMTSRILDGAKAGLDKAIAQHAASGVTVKEVVKQGEPWRAILDAAEELQSDLIVMGTHGRKGLPRALLGSVAERIVRTSKVPVLTIHAEKAAA